MKPGDPRSSMPGRLMVTLNGRVRADIDWLAEQWGMTKSAAVRQAVTEAAENARMRQREKDMRIEFIEKAIELGKSGQLVVPHKDA